MDSNQGYFFAGLVTGAVLGWIYFQYRRVDDAVTGEIRNNPIVRAAATYACGKLR
jgi:hypothetical protein